MPSLLKDPFSMGMGTHFFIFFVRILQRRRRLSFSLPYFRRSSKKCVRGTKSHEFERRFLSKAAAADPGL
jgi:hypothetical protein